MKGQNCEKIQEILNGYEGNVVLLCRVHQLPFYYICNSPECGQFICGKIECLDNHFHNKSLFINKINLIPIIENLNQFQALQNNIQVLKSSLEFIQSQINFLKQDNKNIFQKRRRIQQIYEYLVSQENKPLNNRFFQSLQQIQHLSKQLEAEVNNLSGKINWNKIWITLNSETQIIPKLKLEFQQFRHLNFIRKQIFHQQFVNRWQVIDRSDFQYEGIISLVFTQERFVFGQFIANSNVQTATVFLDSFFFIVNEEGTLKKSLISKNMLNVTPKMSQNQIICQLTFSNCGLIFEKLKISSLIYTSFRINRIQSFLVSQC